MLFLMNDAVLDLGGSDAPPPLAPERLRALTLAHVLRLGAELFSQHPLLHREDTTRARRLALLILSKAPCVNAAQFTAPAAGCSPEAVTSRVAEVSIEIMASLRARSARGALTPVAIDREVWRRMAA